VGAGVLQHSSTLATLYSQKLCQQRKSGSVSAGKLNEI